MHSSARPAAVAIAAFVAGALWPVAGRAFSNVEIGQRIEQAVLPTLDGGKHALVDPKALANVFVFFRLHQEHSERALAAMVECERDFAGKPVHWVGVVSGSWPKEEVRALVKEAGVRMPVLVDEGDALYGALGVRLHPTVGIADGEGKLLAYQPFQRINYCDVVRARIQLALGEITPEQMERASSPDRAPMPSDLRGAVANRHVKLGRMFVKSRNWEKAEQQAREAIAKEPGHAPAHGFLGEVLAGKGDCRAARKAFDEALRLDASNPAAPDWRTTCATR